MTGLAAGSSVGLEHGLLSQLVESHDGRTQIDLSRAEFVEPCGLVAIMCLARAALMDDRVVEVVPPKLGSDCSKYMFRMELPQRLEELGVRAQFTPVKSHPVGNRLHELVPFESGDTGHALVLSGQAPGGPGQSAEVSSASVPVSSATSGTTSAIESQIRVGR